MAHMLFVAGAEVARPPRGLHLTDEPLPRVPIKEVVDAHNEDCRRILEATHAASTAKTRTLQMSGKGCGFAFDTSPYCSFATREGVQVCMVGEVAQWGDLDAVSIGHNAFVRNEPPPEADDAHWLIDFYRTFTEPDSLSESDAAGGPSILDQALDWLATLRGSFAFVIYDSVRHRVLAARDSEGSSPLYWGATASGQLLIGTRLADLEGANPTATAFPAGCLFTSERHMLAFSPGERGWMIAGDDVPGELVSFVPAEDHVHVRGVKAIPRITSQGMVCGAVYKVGSTTDMAHTISQH